MNPVVPTTQWIPLAMHVFRVRITASGVVKSTMTSDAGLAQRRGRHADVDGGHQMQVVRVLDRLDD